MRTWILAGIIMCCAGAAAAQNVDWPSYQGGDDSNQYSALDQIDTQNVAKLEPVWEYHAGDKSVNNRSQLQCNPIIIGGRLYSYSPMQKIFCLDAATGEALWVYSPYEGDAPANATAVKRGLTYWTDGTERRLLCTALSELFALDADTGELIESFGDKGVVDLREGLGRDIGQLYVGVTSPGRVYKDLYIQGQRVSEADPAAPGHIRAFDVRTGKIRWIFRTIPAPGEFGAETWPEGAHEWSGGANNWAGMSLDVERGIVYVPTGSAAYDFYGGRRHGDNLFANCILALDAETGERRWHYQTVRHDVWDRDLPAPPNLVTVTHNGERIDALAQITKSSHIFLLNRETGEPLFPIEERNVPASPLPGESLSPTQPLPTQPPPFARQYLTEDDLTDISPESRAAVLARFRKLHSAGQFYPPSHEGTIVFPGFDGGGEWGGAAFDPESGVLYVNGSEMAWILTMVDKTPTPERSMGEQLYRDACMQCHGPQGMGNSVGGVGMPPVNELHSTRTREQVLDSIVNGKGFMPGFAFLTEEEQAALVELLMSPEELDKITADSVAGATGLREYTTTGYNRFFDPDGYPAIKPPWGLLAAIDLNRGEILWKRTLGEFEELSRRGIPPTGTENYGGPCVTAGGLIFIAATMDEKFRAFDKKTGEMLWETQLPAGGYATPSTYMVDGKQYVVIAAGGGKMGTKSGDSYVAYALP